MAAINFGRAESKERLNLSMIVNGSVRELTVEPRMTLLDALRDELALDRS